MSRSARAVAIGGAILAASALLAAGCRRSETWLHPAQCGIAGRPIRPGMAVEIQREGRGGPERVCCLRCAISEARQTGSTVRILSVTDYPSHEQLRPERAVYVTHSKANPCAGPPVDVPASRREASVRSWDRCLPSIIAFGSREDARRFQEEAGGIIQTFAELVQGTGVVAGE